MNKISKLSFFVLMVVLLVVSLPTYAENPDSNVLSTVRPSPKRVEVIKEVREEARDKLQANKENRKDKIVETRKKLDEKRRRAVVSFWEHARKRFEKILDNEAKFIDRVQALIDKFAKRGKNVVAAQAQLDIAKAKLVAAKARLSELSITATTAFESELPKTNFENVKNLAKEFERIVKDLHQSIERTLRILRGNSKVSPSPDTSIFPSESAVPLPKPN